MDPKIISGKTIAAKRELALSEKVQKLPTPPKVVSILVGDDAPSLLYTKMKQKKASELGIQFDYIHYPDSEPFHNVAMNIVKLNGDSTVNGILVQLPLPKEFLQNNTTEDLLKNIAAEKDVDGLTGKSSFLGGAVKAILTILEEEQIKVSGKFVVVLGTSTLVGRPIAAELKKVGALVSSVNDQTENISQITKRADIIISATGSAGSLTGEMVKEGVIVIDVGTLVINDQSDAENKKVVGDVDFESVLPKAAKITPVPGGVGPVTVISLMENVVEAALR